VRSTRAFSSSRRSADAAKQEHVGALRLDGQAHLGLDLEVRRSPVLDEVDEGEVPQIEAQIHGGSVCSAGPSGHVPAG
jgi:hypothetical protein